MKLTDRQLAVLAHVVENPQEWADNAIKEDHVLAKIAKYEAAYDEAVAKGNYKNRKQRDEAEAQAEKDRYDNAGYAEKRRRNFASIGDQLDMQYKDLLNGTSTWKDHVAKVKSDFVKD
tara:strand:- start:132 stop:485 length:354 start_codon:yes stop_codon:yes gene_type:complete